MGSGKKKRKEKGMQSAERTAKAPEFVLPAGFARRMRSFLGEEEYLCFAASYHREPRRALRTNTLLLSPEELAAALPESFGLSPVPWAEEGFYYRSAEEVRPGLHPFHDAGLYYMQEPSAMAVAALSGVCPGERVLDLCAAPGGKTTQLAARMRGQGLLVSNEISPARVRVLSQNVERMGLSGVIVTNETPEALARRFPAYFDRIVVDAPCSGEGMFLKEEQARIGWTEDNIRLCAARQDEILEAAQSMLCEGGVLVYSTCTFAPEENEGTVLRFLSAYPDFHIQAAPESCFRAGIAAGQPDFLENPEYLAGCLPGTVPERRAELREELEAELREELSLSLRLWPHRLEGEGHFVCILKRDGQRADKAEGERPRRADEEALRLWRSFRMENLTGPEEAELSEERIISFGDELYLLPCPISLNGLKTLRPGLDLGTVKRGRFEPSHALALGGGGVGLCPKRSVNFAPEDVRVRNYLWGDTLFLEPESMDEAGEEKGWVLVRTAGWPLGWAKAAGGVLKNHYPRGLRRMSERGLNNEKNLS
ncbi:RsmB/NOP family class I SAM-dependent RNA methyltransferase [Lachnoclostridium sp. Marseille-P6806]|uniref:RsmB/NOP family class I SAM-dependent RNA methyltransferase n=1 Tax=Lachnoclostridium sp. Marseille-P6806 TaxID=2364793 RepID=UPI001F5E5CA3|nr:RsmB/NOP family class I SAM-dependent RNA methyltransferase [Lachnoclostridium sp. Marseille-P6806]